MMSLYHCFLHVRNLVCVLIFGYMFSTNFHFTLPMPAPEKSVIYVNHSIFNVNHLNFADFFSAGDFTDFSGEKVGKKVTQSELFLGNFRKKEERSINVFWYFLLTYDDSEVMLRKTDEIWNQNTENQKLFLNEL